ncbi:oxidoreductase [Virgisporangium aliadipatigenens]|uniref:Oxidoreductase n=1 Tax=Virgisporangium aliadipatigenens TaxID=741659 RepID=A0A8J4DUI8_9ACTN|nr:FAD-dependent monooxygenase [Virgisporangium aliadipatigenens]GIJ50411.1 oxidoreductase [Virgisporangium aliadipatigenens]
MSPRDVLILGAGVAGPTLAFWLARHGMRPVVVEQAATLRSSGNPIDVKGPAVHVAEQMGVLPRLRAAATAVTGVTLLDLAGRPMARLPTAPEGSQDIEITRADLATIMFEAAVDSAEYLFGDTVVSLTQDLAGVDVTFAKAAPRRFDLVIGTDGIHSTIRRMEFGPEERFARDLGINLATVPVPLDAVRDRHDMVVYNAPGRLALLHPGKVEGLAMFVFHGPASPGRDRRDKVAHTELVTDTYRGLGWRVPELVDALRQHPDPYFDRLSQIRIDSWSRGRVALLGDAASSVAIFGDGSTLAVAGAHTLAGALAANPTDHTRAFREYETTHRRLVNPKVRQIKPLAALLIPRTGRGLAARNLTTRALARVFADRFAPKLSTATR